MKWEEKKLYFVHIKVSFKVYFRFFNNQLNYSVLKSKVNKEAELSVHVFPGLPPAPGQPCHGEDR